MALVTCRTSGCASEGKEIDAVTEWTDEEGPTHPVDQVVCGACGQEITEVRQS